MNRFLRCLAIAGSLAVSSPVLADTLTCVSTDGAVKLNAEVAFTADRDDGVVEMVRVETPYLVMSTAADETLAFSNVASDRIEVGLESPGVGPMTLYLDLVRLAESDGNGGPDTDIVVAGVARVASVGTRTLECQGWL
jgi:hypothetical protein